MAGSCFLLLGFRLLGGKKVSLFQRDAETPKTWAGARPFSWAVRNGVALGSGWYSRIGFHIWYAVPLACLALGSAKLGVLIYGAYGLTRALAGRLALLLVAEEEWNHGLWLLTRVSEAQRASAQAVVLVGATLTTFAAV